MFKVNEGETKAGPRVVVVDKGGKEIPGAPLPADLKVAPVDPAIATDTVDASGVITVTGGNAVGATNLVATGGGFTSDPYEVDVAPAPAGLAILDPA